MLLHTQFLVISQLAPGIMKGKRTPTPNQKEKALQSKGTMHTREEAMKTRNIPLVKEMEIQRTVQSVQGIIIYMTVLNSKGESCWPTYWYCNDNPKALKPREIKQSRRKGPIVVRTVFGWTIESLR